MICNCVLFNYVNCCYTMPLKVYGSVFKTYFDFLIFVTFICVGFIHVRIINIELNPKSSSLEVMMSENKINRMPDL